MNKVIDRIEGRITAIHTDGTVTISAYYGDLTTLIKRDYKNVTVQFHDSRKVSHKQRNMCWSMISDIAEWQGSTRSQTAKDMANHARKVDFMINELGENADTLFSLSDAPMSLVAAYQSYLIRFILENDIPTKRPLYDYAEDISDYIYMCLIHKKCAVCGRPSELHHIDAVGMGRDRKEIVHEGMRCLPLCREHHSECHNKGNKDFMELYHFDEGVIIDKTLAKIYKLKAREVKQ